MSTRESARTQGGRGRERAPRDLRELDRPPRCSLPPFHDRAGGPGGGVAAARPRGPPRAGRRACRPPHRPRRPQLRVVVADAGGAARARSRPPGCRGESSAAIRRAGVRRFPTRPPPVRRGAGRGGSCPCDPRVREPPGQGSRPGSRQSDHAPRAVPRPTRRPPAVERDATRSRP